MKERAASNPLQTTAVYPHPLRYSRIAFCSGDTLPPLVRFISMNKRQAGMKISGTPGHTPSAFSLIAVTLLRYSPFGMANSKTPGYLARNHCTSIDCSACSEGIGKLFFFMLEILQAVGWHVKRQHIIEICLFVLAVRDRFRRHGTIFRCLHKRLPLAAHPWHVPLWKAAVFSVEVDYFVFLPGLTNGVV